MPRRIPCWVRPWVGSFRPAQRPRENLGDKNQTGPAATPSRTGHLFAYLALCFMTRRDLHDWRSGRRNGEPYGLSFILSCSIQGRQIDVITMTATRETDTGDIEGSLALQENQMGLPPGKRWQVWGDPVELPHMTMTARRQLIQLNCSHAKNWGANSVRALSLVRNPLSGIMKGSWLPA